jgi:hypothetical protein
LSYEAPHVLFELSKHQETPGSCPGTRRIGQVFGLALHAVEKAGLRVETGGFALVEGCEPGEAKRFVAARGQRQGAEQIAGRLVLAKAQRVEILLRRGSDRLRQTGARELAREDPRMAEKSWS